MTSEPSQLRSNRNPYINRTAYVDRPTRSDYPDLSPLALQIAQSDWDTAERARQLNASALMRRIEEEDRSPPDAA